MTDKDLETMLKQDYSITISGSVLGYLLVMLSEKQHELNKKARDNIMDVMAHMSAGANDVVGNSLLMEAYRVAGEKFLAFVMDSDPEGMKDLMESKTEAEFDAASKKLGLKPETPPKGTKLN